ncbi:MAG: IS982 family transposase [Ferruginibacter sp.]|nr:IS982 family transposase [Ferruginibacter sp.]
MHNIKVNFDKIIDVVKDILRDELTVRNNFKRRGVIPRFSDVEVISLSLTAESLGIDSENYLFSKLLKEYSHEFINLISRRQYNDRRKLLFEQTERARKLMVERLNEQVDVFAIDSMPLEICKIAREQRNKMGKESEQNSPDKGYCASQKKYFYGYKLHSVCSATGVIESLDLTKASVHDVHYLKDVKELFSNCMIIGDKGYIGRQHQINLFESAGIELEVPLRNNQKEQKPTMWILKKVRKRIETVFSQLCDQFMIQRNYAKSFAGFKARILAKITGFTILQFLNKFIYNKPISRVKHTLAN